MRPCCVELRQWRGVLTLPYEKARQAAGSACRARTFTILRGARKNAPQHINALTAPVESSRAAVKSAAVANLADP